MAEDQDRSQQTEAPSQRKLDEARRKGDVARSPEVPAALSLAAALGVAAIGAGPFARGMTAALTPFLAHPDAFSLGPGGGGLVLAQAIRAATPGFLVLAAAAAAGVAGAVLQQGVLWSPSKLAPDFSRVSPMEGLKRLFGLDSVISFSKAFLKLLAVAACAWLVLKPRAAQFAQMPGLDLGAVLPVSGEMLRGLAFAVLAMAVVLAAADWLVARQRFIARMRMSREELKQDTKDSDGDPHVKARQKQIRAERSRRRMMQAVPKATVVVMNPTHFAVALRYEQGVDAAPVCVAKGMDSLALRIREVAEAAEVPVVENPPLARALYAAMDVDDVIPREHFEAVARLIGFVFQSARGRRGAARPPLPRRASPG